MATDGGHSTKAAERIIIPLDVSRMKDAVRLIDLLAPFGVWFKIGFEALYSYLFAAIVGNDDPVDVPECIRRIKGMGGKVFIDGKLHDIPNTMAGAARNIAAAGVDAFNLHASAGVEAMSQVVANRGNAEVWAVTALTSLTADDFDRLGFVQFPGGGLPRDHSRDIGEHIQADVIYMERLVLSMVNRAEEAGCQGVICSAKELSVLSGVNLRKVTPGIRPEWAVANDQKRVMTPRQAIAAGADLLVIGRPITDPPESIADPVEALLKVAEEIETGLAERAARDRDYTDGWGQVGGRESLDKGGA